MNSITYLIRADLQTFKAYSSSRDEATQGDIWLNANESPYERLVENTMLNRYPDKQPAQLLAALAQLYQIGADQLVLSRGSDEMIDLLIRLFCKAEQDAILICPPTFGMYAVFAQLQGARTIEVPLLEETNQLNVPEILANKGKKIKIIFLCSPNNPTGNLLEINDILTLSQQLRDESIIVVDEAYIEFADRPSMSTYINQYPNLVILRTFSKSYGLAGARCGLLIAQQEIVQWIKKIIAPYPVSSLTTLMVMEVISADHLMKIQEQITVIKAEREQLASHLMKLSCVKKIWPSVANFLLVQVSDDQLVMQACAKDGIILRNLSQQIKNCVRISIGLPEENAKLLAVLAGVPAT